jgi:hypothetical protein
MWYEAHVVCKHGISQSMLDLRLLTLVCMLVSASDVLRILPTSTMRMPLMKGTFTWAATR